MLEDPGDDEPLLRGDGRPVTGEKPGQVSREQSVRSIQPVGNRPLQAWPGVDDRGGMGLFGVAADGSLLTSAGTTWRAQSWRTQLWSATMERPSAIATSPLARVNLDPPGRGRIYDGIVETITNTPLVRVQRFADARGVAADLLMKLEFFGPAGSVKDRIALSMILDLEEKGLLAPGGTIIEPTSGNTGIGLACVGSARGYRVIVTMPDSMSVERRQMMEIFGAEVVLTPRAEGINGSIAKAAELRDSIPGSVIPDQFANAANPMVHELTTAEEIWADTDGAVDVIVSGIGTGGTFTGCARALRPRKPSLRMVAVEPEESQVLGGGTHSPHPIQGIGPGIVADVMDTDAIDERVAIDGAQAVATAREFAATEGIAVGISSGAAIEAAVQLGCRPELADATIVCIVPSFAERYLSTVLVEASS